MKNHLLTIMLLLVAGTSFTLRFFTENTEQNICDILAFALPTLVAIVEIIIAEKGNKKFADELKKRPPFEYLSEEEFERQKVEGKIDEETIYATRE